MAASKKKQSTPKQTKSPLDGLTPKDGSRFAIAWIEEYCRIPEGPRVGKRVKLRAWQCQILQEIYDNPYGTRRAIISFGRKNGKTSLVAFIMLLHLCSDMLIVNSHIYSAAQSRDQAGILFRLAAKVVRLSPILAANVIVRDHAKELEFKAAGTKYNALSAEAATAFGLSPALVIHDELGQVRGPRSELYEALETATAAHSRPLSIIISTQAPNDGDLLSMLIDDALAKNDPHTVIRLYTASPELDPFSDEAIQAANPAFGDFQNAEEVRATALRAKRMPASEASYRNLYLNQRVAASTRFISPSTWIACNTPQQSIIEVPVFGGLDLSAVDDLTACVLIGQIGGIWQVWPTFWLPEDNLIERAKRDRVPYDLWVSNGYITTVPGKSVDYSYIAEWLRDVFDKFRIQKIGFDRWNFAQLKPWLLRADFTEERIETHFEEFGQGFQSMSPALRVLEAEILNCRIAHGMNPVLTMCADNAVVQSDPAGNRKLNKAKSVRRIDGMVALAMAFGVTNLQVEAPEYEIFVI